MTQFGSEGNESKEKLKTFVVKKTFDGTKFQDLENIKEKSQTKETKPVNNREFKENKNLGSRTRRSFGGVPSRQLQERNSLLNVIPIENDHNVETDVLTSLVPLVKKLPGKSNTVTFDLTHLCLIASLLSCTGRYFLINI